MKKCIENITVGYFKNYWNIKEENTFIDLEVPNGRLKGIINSDKKISFIIDKIKITDLYYYFFIDGPFSGL